MRFDPNIYSKLLADPAANSLVLLQDQLRSIIYKITRLNKREYVLVVNSDNREQKEKVNNKLIVNT